MALAARNQGQKEEALRMAEQSHRLYRELGDRAGIVWSGQRLGGCLFFVGNDKAALDVYEETRALAQELGDHVRLAAIYHSLCEVNRKFGRYEQAHSAGQRSLSIALKIGDQSRIGWGQYILGITALWEQSYPEAQGLLQHAAATFETIDRRHDLAMAYSGLAISAWGLGKLPEAKQYSLQALRNGLEYTDVRPTYWALIALVMVTIDEGNLVEAVSLYSLVTHYTGVSSGCWFKDVIGKRIEEVLDSLPDDIGEAALADGRAFDVWETAAEQVAKLENQAGRKHPHV